MGVALDGDQSVSLVEPLLWASAARLVREELRREAALDAARGLRIVRDALRTRTLDVALRQLDRAWRCRPEDAATLAPIYGRVLLLEASDHDAALNLLRCAAELAPDPEGAALMAWALFRAERHDQARGQLVAALASYAVSPGDLLFEVAGGLIQRLTDIPGWIGRAPDLRLIGELARDGPVTETEMRIEIDGHATPSRPLDDSPRPDRRTFRIEYTPRDRDWTLEARVRGVPLLGSGTRIPVNFALDGRVAHRERRLEGWARLGWEPSRALRIAVEDEHGRLGSTQTRPASRSGGGYPFEFDLAAAGIAGNRLVVTVQLPDGRWQPLPDSPLLLEAPLPERRGTRGRSRPWGVEAARSRARSVIPARAPVDIIIPVYRDRDATLACIDAVLETIDDAQVVVVDDATEDVGLAAALDALAAAGRITLLRHIENLGFVVAANRGMALNPTHDAVLLNADTRVFGDWLGRLREAAYGGADVGTVTPWSNSGSIASYPRPQGSALDPEQAAALNDLAAEVNSGVRVPIPVGVGFCLYIRRDCLTDVGALAADVFDKGYGEETDFCARARARGWSHQLAADVFVYHAGGRSFGERRAALLERSQRLINLRHPGYDQRIAEWLAEDQLRRVRRRLDEQRLRAFGRFVLLVTPAVSGGVDRFVTERCRELRAQGLSPLRLQPAAAGDPRRCQLTTDVLDVPNLLYEIPADLPDLRALLRELPIDSIDIQHFLHLDPAVIEAVRALPVPYDVVVHDYAWICPRITLIDGSGKYCGEPALRVCERCVRTHGSLSGEALTVAQLRARSDTWLRGARRVIAPSADTAARLRRHFPELSVAVEPHAIAALFSPTLPPPPRDATRKLVRVALLGAIGEHKGYRVLLECAENARARRLSLEFVVIGYTENDAPLLATGKVFVTGRYTEAEVPHLLRRERPDVLWLPSVWPETWCYALDHALQFAGEELPVVAFDLGAIAERLRAAGSGELLPLGLEAPRLNDALLRLAAPVKNSAVPASRSGHFALTPPTHAATMDLTKPREPIMTNSSDPTAAAPAQAAVMSSSVQVLQLNFGLYLFSVKSTAGAVSSGGALQLPAMHVGLGPGVPAEHVEFMSGPATQGAWLFAATDQLVVKVHGAGATLILTSVHAPAGAALSIKIERLDGRCDATPLADADPAPREPEGSLPVHIAAHIRSRGDMNFRAAPWAGRVAPGLWMESFSLHLLDPFTDQDLEYKGLTGSGFETPWISDNQPCGTKGLAVPLVGFALRLKPTPATAGYDCEYSAYFQSGVTVGPLRNGAPCRSTVANDPLEGIQVRLVKRAAAAAAAAAAAPQLDRATPAQSAAAAREATPTSPRGGRPALRHAARGP